MRKLTRSPIIGLTTYGKQEGKYYLPSGYVEAVVKAGGVPLLLPPVQTDLALMLESLDGLLLIGGGDIDPVCYNGSSHPAVYGVDTERDHFELSLVKVALETELPMLGLCRGLQIMMVATGGDIVPHLPDEYGEAISHRAAKGLPQSKHLVELQPGSKLANAMGATAVTVVSLHHQCVRTVPLGWRVTGWAPDGLIEALEHEHHPFAIAVQWHPELSQDDPDHQNLFHAFIEAARTRKTSQALVAY